MNASAALAILAVILAGGATALQAPTNARLATAVGGTVNAAFVSFAVGTAVLGMMALMVQTRPDMAATRGLPWYAWIGGVYGVIFVVAATWAVPRMGVATTIILMVAGQLIVSLVLDHFGAFGVPRQPISWNRIGGVVLVVCGVLLARRG